MYFLSEEWVNTLSKIYVTQSIDPITENVDLYEFEYMLLSKWK